MAGARNCRFRYLDRRGAAIGGAQKVFALSDGDKPTLAGWIAGAGAS